MKFLVCRNVGNDCHEEKAKLLAKLVVIYRLILPICVQEENVSRTHNIYI